MPDTWLQVFLRQEKLHLLVQLLSILDSAEVNLVGEDVRITVDYDKLNSDQIGKISELQQEHQFALLIGDR